MYKTTEGVTKRSSSAVTLKKCLVLTAGSVIDGPESLTQTLDMSYLLVIKKSKLPPDLLWATSC